MNVNYEKLGDVRGEIVVTLEEKDYADKVKKQLKEIGRRRPEPGFRAGKVPAGLLEKKYGKAAKYEIINQTVGEAVYDYIKENNLHVLGNPVPVKDNEINFDDADFTFKFEVGLAPEFDTHVNKDMHVPYYRIAVADDMMKRQDEALRRRFGKQESGEVIDETAVVKGVITELEADGSDKENGVVVENGIIAPEHFTDADQRSLFVGKKVGDTIVFNPSATCGHNATELSSMLNIDKNEVDNHKGDFRFEVKEAIVLKPAEVGEEYFKQVFGPDKVHNEEEYNEELRKMIAQALERDSNYRFTIDAKTAILNAVGKLELPDDILKAYLMTQNEALTPENIDEQYAAMRPQLEWELIREAVCAQLNVKLEKEDVEEMARFVARQQFAQYGMTSVPDDMLIKYAGEILKDERARQQISQQALDNKFYSAVHEAVTADEKDVNVEEFNALFAPAAEAEEAAEQADA